MKLFVKKGITVFCLLVICSCNPNYDDGCGGTPIQINLSKNSKSYLSYNIGDTINLIDKNDSIYHFRGVYYEDAKEIIQESGACPPPREEAQYLRCYFFDSLNLLNFYFGVHAKSYKCVNGSTYLSYEDVIRAGFSNTQFYYQLPKTYFSKDSFNYGDGYFYLSKEIHGKIYDSVFVCTNTYCSKNDNNLRKLWFNKKYGILRVDLENTYLERYD